MSCKILNLHPHSEISLKMKKMDKRGMSVLIALCIATMLSNHSVNGIGCPEKCTCQQSIVKCIRQQLKFIPEVPTQTNIM